jgi:hypothetical protein
MQMTKKRTKLPAAAVSRSKPYSPAPNSATDIIRNAILAEMEATAKKLANLAGGEVEIRTELNPSLRFVRHDKHGQATVYALGTLATPER